MKKLLVNFILDESGSMTCIKDQTISGFNEYVDSLKPKGKAARFTFTKFNSEKTNIVCDNIPVKDVLLLTSQNYCPSALTPLYDAIGGSIKAIEKALTKEPLDVLCVIMTDGQENCSREFTRNRIFEIIAEKQKEGWTFAYLGANQDSWGEGEKVGIVGSNTMDFAYDSTGVTRAFASTIVATGRYMSNRISSYASGHSQAVASTNYFANMEELKDDVEEYEKKIKERNDNKIGGI